MTTEPRDETAERIVLSAIFHDCAGAERIFELDPGVFVGYGHREAFDAMCRLRARGFREIDPRSLGTELRGLPRHQEITSQILDESPVNLDVHVRQLQELSVRRDLIAGLRGVSEAAHDVGEPLSKVRSLLDGVAQTVVPDSAPETWAEVADRVYTEIRTGRRRASRRPTGIPALDSALGGGLGAGWLAILMAAPKVGKSALALQIAAHACLRGEAVFFVSLEMMPDLLYGRLLAHQSGVPSTAWDKPHNEELRDLADAHDSIRDWAFEPVTHVRGVDDLARVVRDYRRRAPRRLGLIVVDYVQLLSNGKDNQAYDLAMTSRGLKRLAQEMEVPVLALVQPNNAARKEKEIGRHDASGSGAFEADADVMLLLNGASPGVGGFRDVSLKVDAFRHGQSGQPLRLAFDGSRQTFVAPARDRQEATDARE